MSKEKGFWAEFKAFISRGSVMDMAVGIIIGSAFTAIVQSLTNDILLPIVSIFVGGVDFADMKIIVRAATDADPGLFIHYGKLIQAIVNFLLIALCIFTIVRALNKMHEKANARKLAEQKAAEEAAAAAKAAEPAPVDERLETLKAIKAILEKKA